MKSTIQFALFFGTASAWNWSEGYHRRVDNRRNNKTSPMMQPSAIDVCWKSMAMKTWGFSNYTAVFQPGYWEQAFPEIMEFCSSRSNGSYCFRPKSQWDGVCLDSALVQCPEGIFSSCRSNYICQELVHRNVTCDSGIGSVFSDQNSYTEGSQARCQAIEDVLVLPQGTNFTTTINAQNATITVGQQEFGFPFAMTTTVSCTMTCLSLLPTGMPQPSAATSVCFNSNLPYDKMVPQSTCVGPYPPGPMTTITVTESMSGSSPSTTTSDKATTPTETSVGGCSVESSMVCSTSMSPTEPSDSGCPIESSVQSASHYYSSEPAVECPMSTSSTVGPCEPATQAAYH